MGYAVENYPYEVKDRPKVKGMADAQVFIIRNIVMSTVALLVNLFADFGLNLLHAVGLYGQSHPYHLGFFQWTVAVFFGLFLVVSIRDARYWF